MPSYVPKPRDKNRLTVTFPASNYWPSNLAYAYGWYLRSSAPAGNVTVRRVRAARLPFETNVALTATGKDHRPVIGADHRERLWCLWHRNNPPGTFNVYEAYSDDDGATWSSEALVFSSGRYPQIATDPSSGTVLKAAYVSGYLKGILRYPGDLANRSEFTFNLAGSVPLQVANDTFGIAWIPDAQRRLILHVRLLNETDTREYVSFDDGATWTLMT